MNTTSNAFALVLQFYESFRVCKLTAADLGKIAKKYAPKPQQLLKDLRAKYGHPVPAEVTLPQLTRLLALYDVPPAYRALLPTTASPPPPGPSAANVAPVKVESAPRAPSTPSSLAPLAPPTAAAAAAPARAYDPALDVLSPHFDPMASLLAAALADKPAPGAQPAPAARGRGAGSSGGACAPSGTLGSIPLPPLPIALPAHALGLPYVSAEAWRARLFDNLAKARHLVFPAEYEFRYLPSSFPLELYLAEWGGLLCWARFASCLG